jgi:hypothetical protein
VLGEAGDTLRLFGSWTNLGTNSGGTGFDVWTADAAPNVKVVVDNEFNVVTGP